MVISSATAEAEKFRDFFGADKTAICSVEGRQYPVDIFYAEQPLGSTRRRRSTRDAKKGSRRRGKSARERGGLDVPGHEKSGLSFAFAVSRARALSLSLSVYTRFDDD